jgi:hypothetical protein
MASRSIGRKNQNESLDWMDREDDVRGRGDEMDDAPKETDETDEFEGPDDLNDEAEEEGEGSF